MFWNGMMLLSTLLARTASVRQRTGAYGVDFFICVGLVRSRNNPIHMYLSGDFLSKPTQNRLILRCGIHLQMHGVALPVSETP